jgi:hypothetical protein
MDGDEVREPVHRRGRGVTRRCAEVGFFGAEGANQTSLPHRSKQGRDPLISNRPHIPFLCETSALLRVLRG